MTATEFSARQDLGLSNFGALWASRNAGTRDVGKDAISGVIPGTGADGVLGPDPRILDRDQSQASDRNEFVNVRFWG